MIPYTKKELDKFQRHVGQLMMSRDVVDGNLLVFIHAVDLETRASPVYNVQYICDDTRLNGQERWLACRIIHQNYKVCRG